MSDPAPQPPIRPLWITVAIAALAIVGLVSFLVYNVVSHALNETAVTPVSHEVLSVTPTGPSSIRIVAEVTSKGTSTAEITCLDGVVAPGLPLAWQQKQTVTLAPGTSHRFVIDRTLLHPDADQVTIADVAFTCT